MSDLVREVTVICGSNRRFVKVDFGNYKNTIKAIRQKWNLPSETFQLQTCMDGKGNYYDIVDNEDLVRFRNSDELVIRMISQEVARRPGHFLDEPNPPPSYELSQEHDRELRITVHLGDATKEIVLYSTNFEALQKTITKRFRLQDEFQLQLENANGERINIDCEEDIEDNQAFIHDIWVVDEEMGGALVKVDGIPYSLKQLPRNNQPIIQTAIKDMQVHLRIGEIQRTLQIVGDCLRLAYYGVVGQRGLQQQVQEIQFEVTRICQDMDVLIAEFETKSCDIMNDLESGFDFLLEDLGEFALDNFSSIAKTCAEMKNKSTATLAALKDRLSKIEGAMRCAMDKKEGGSKEEVAKKVKLEKNLEELRLDASRAEEGKISCRKDEDEYRDRETAALNDTGTYRHAFFKILSLGVYKGSVPVAKQQADLAEKARSDYEHHREELGLLRAKESQAIEELLELDLASDEVVKRALHGVHTGLRGLNVSLVAGRLFLGLIKSQCESLGNRKFFHQMKKLRKSDKATKEKYWEGNGFKRGALRFFASWVAMRDICREFHAGMKPIEQKLHDCIVDNPDTEEARAKIKGMLEEFNKSMKKRKREAEAEKENAT